MDILSDVVSQKSGQICRHIILWVYKMSVRVHIYRHCNLQLSTGTSSFLTKSDMHGNAMDLAFRQ